MRALTILLLCLVQYQPPHRTFIHSEAMACISIQHWIKYMQAAYKDDRRTLQLLHMSQRCVYQGPEEVTVLSRTPNYIAILGKDQRTLYTSKEYLLE